MGRERKTTDLHFYLLTATRSELVFLGCLVQCVEDVLSGADMLAAEGEAIDVLQRHKEDGSEVQQNTSRSSLLPSLPRLDSTWWTGVKE